MNQMVNGDRTTSRKERGNNGKANNDHLRQMREESIGV